MTALSRGELRLELRSLIARDWIEIPDLKRYCGTGGPGKVLGDKLNVEGGNDDLPDSGR